MSGDEQAYGEQVAARLRKGHQLAGELSLFIGYAHDVIPRHSGGQMQIEATDASHKIIEGAILYAHQ